MPQKQRPRGRLWLNDGSCVRLRPERPNHVWSYDFMSARTHEGRTLRLLTLLDEYRRECLAIRAVLLEHGGKFFLSSIDDQEGWRTRAYFLCQLPNLVMSVDEAFDLLIPQQVQSAKVGGIEVRSQCDIFLRFPPAHLATPC